MATTPSTTAPLALARRVGATTTSRRRFLGMLAAVPLAGVALSACGTSGPAGASGSGGAEDISMWYLSGKPNEAMKTSTIATWNAAHENETVGLTFFQNDAFKMKIKTAIGAGQAPTLIYGWGGGTLREYADAKQVVDLTDWLAQNPDVKKAVLPSTYAAATVDGKIYAYPNENAALIVFYYNKDLFAKAGLTPPTTWDELLSAVDTFNGMGVAPISLAGQSRWTSMMWLEYLYDRVGGSQVFQDIYDGKADAWSAEGSIKALTMAQDLVRRKGFITGFESIAADSNADIALMYTGKAAMMLHGSWTYSGMKAEAPDFVSSSLGWSNFPAVTGGAGDPTNAAGNPAQYMSISASATDAQVTAAKDYLATGLMDTEVVDSYLDSGQVCVATGIDDKIAASPDKAFLTFAYGTVRDAPTFVQSWDQALSPSTAEKLLTTIDGLFSLALTPQDFATTMNATLGS